MESIDNVNSKDENQNNHRKCFYCERWVQNIHKGRINAVTKKELIERIAQFKPGIKLGDMMCNKCNEKIRTSISKQQTKGC